MKQHVRWIGRLALMAALAYGTQAACAEEGNAGIDARHTFYIPRQSLSAALLTFSSQADIQVMTSSADLDNLTSNEVWGEQTTRQALTVLLRDTGLKFHVISRDAVSIEPIESDAGRVIRTTPVVRDE